jgi:MoaA/NifB/PqqE/SkfB family radical SAM enzyme
VEREKKSGHEAYLRNIKMLVQTGFQVMCSLVATPEALKRFDEAIDLLAPIGMYPIPKVLRGLHEQRGYPHAYNRSERQAFRQYTASARKFYEPLFAGRDERPTADIFGDVDMLHGTPDYGGLMCEAGRLFFKIEPNGDVLRCGDSRRYGNLLNASFFREEAASPCDTFYCFYFCKKYSEPPPLTRRLHRLARVTAREILR